MEGVDVYRVGDGAGWSHGAQSRQSLQAVERALGGEGLGHVTRVKAVAEAGQAIIVTIIDQVQKVCLSISDVKTALMKVSVGDELFPVLK